MIYGNAINEDLRWNNYQNIIYQQNYNFSKLSKIIDIEQLLKDYCCYIYIKEKLVEKYQKNDG
jgi:hypothetical protein